MDDERLAALKSRQVAPASLSVVAGNPLQRLGRREIFEQWGDYFGHYCALSRKDFRVIRTFLKVAKSASPLRGTRKTRQCDFRKAEAKLVPPPCPAAPCRPWNPPTQKTIEFADILRRANTRRAVEHGPGPEF